MRCVGQAFEFVGNWGKYLPLWDPSILSVTQTSPEPLALGTKFDVQLKDGSDKFEYGRHCV